MKTRTLFLLGALLLATTPALAADPLAPAAERPLLGDFALPTLDGGKVALADHKGKVVLVSFWATWCKPCKQELPLLDALGKKYADRGLVVLSINTDAPKTQADVRRTVTTKGLTLPILLDGDGKVSGRLNPRVAMPFAIYVDRQGRRALEVEGFAPGDEALLEQRIVALLDEK